VRRAITAVLIVLGAALAVGAEPITIGESVKIQSKVLGEERTILISTPANYAQSQERFPVLYMTDGNAHLTHTRGTVDFLVRNNLMPDLIIVAVTNTDRTRDLSPTRATRRLPDGTRQEIPNSGGAAKFLEFFDKELFPYVEGNYRTEPYRIFAGHSLGGLLALYIFTARPDLFNAYIAASPALSWDDDYILGKVNGFVNEHKGSGRTLFVTMANEEENDPKPDRFDRLNTTLDSAKVAGFVWGSMRMPDETHGSVVLRTHYYGLRKIFDGWRLPLGSASSPFNLTFAEVTQHYARLSKRFAYTVLPPELLVNQAGYLLLGQNRTEEAIAMFRGNVQLYPDAANVYDSLGEALERAGRTEEALVNYNKAVATARERGDGRLEVFTANRDRALTAAKQKNPGP
jgi:predicted alpha/beta superfamily hydrolase